MAITMSTLNFECLERLEACASLMRHHMYARKGVYDFKHLDKLYGLGFINPNFDQRLYLREPLHHYSE